MRKTSKRTTYFITAVLAAISCVFIYTSSKSTLKSSAKNFAIDDTSSVTKIFLSDKQNQSVTLEKQTSGVWLLNNTFNAKTELVSTLLKTMMQLEVKEPVSKAAHNNVVKRLASSGIKVEIYQRKYFIDFWGIKLFSHEKCTKTYYVGDATQNMMGTYMAIEDSDPYIVFIPGFDGFLFTRYSTKVDDWRDHTVFNLRLAQIKSITLEFPLNPELSYTVYNSGDRTFELTALQNQTKIADFDTMKVLELMSSFENVRYESSLNNLPQTRKDSVLKTVPYHILTITDKEGKSKSIQTYHMKANQGEVDEVTNEPVPYNRDRMYALINNKQDFVMIQFYVFDNLIKPLPYYLKRK